MLQLVSLIKRRDVDPAIDEPDPERAPVNGVVGGCSPVAGCPAADGSDDDMSDAGMSTVEYAVGTVAAAAFAAVLYQVVTGDSVMSGLTDLIDRAMSAF